MANPRDIVSSQPVTEQLENPRTTPDAVTFVKRAVSLGNATITLRRRPTEVLPNVAINPATATAINSPDQKKNPVLQVKAYTQETMRLALDPRQATAMQRAAAGLQTMVSTPKGPAVPGRPPVHAPASLIGRFLERALDGGDASGLPEQRSDLYPSDSHKTLRGTPFFQDIPDQELLAAVDSQDIKILSLKRDTLLEHRSRAVLVLSGQLGLGLFQPNKLQAELRAQRLLARDPKQAEKADYRRRLDVGPLIRLTERNLATISPGELIELEDPHPAGTVALFSITPVTLVSISQSRLDAWCERSEIFRNRRRRANQMTQDRIGASASDSERGLVADFFVRHGKSIATTMRVRDLEKCIECYACERACADRYGAQRLFLDGKTLGTLDFVNCCQTCVDQRCVDSCSYDALRFDAQKGEVVIQEDACTGCTMCARACPYDAITMYELDEQPLLKLRLGKEKKLEHGEGKPRKAALRRIASKCDHCMNFEDQACITACPTDALLEVPPLGLFAARTEQMSSAAAAAYPATVRVDKEELFTIDPFIGRMKLKQAGESKKLNIEKRSPFPALWLLSLLLVAGCIAEIALRLSVPTWSLQFLYATRVAHEDSNLAQLDVAYRATMPLGIWLGRVGAILLASSMLYSVFARTRWLRPVPFLRRISSQGWFDYHVWSGTMGMLLILLHTGFNLSPKLGSLAALTSAPALIGFWLMAIVVLSGVVGRYLAPGTPALASQALKRQHALQEDLARLRNQHGGVLAADLYFEKLGQKYARVAGANPEQPRQHGWGTAMKALFTLLWDEFLKPFRALWLRRRLQGIKDRTARAQVAKIVSQLARLERQTLLTPLLVPLFRWWRLLHVPSAIILSVTALLHIVFEEIVRPLLESGGHP